MSGQLLIPAVPMIALSDFAQHVFRVCRGPKGCMLADKEPGVLAACDELVAAGYARIVPDLRVSDQRIEMVDVHGSFAMADGGDGAQNVVIGIVSPRNPYEGDGLLLAVLTNFEFSIISDDPWPTAGIFAFHEYLIDPDDEAIRIASLTIANPKLMLSDGAGCQVWIGTLTEAHLYPAGADIAVASMSDPGNHRFLPPSITSIIPSVVRVTIHPSQSFLSAKRGELATKSWVAGQGMHVPSLNVAVYRHRVRCAAPRGG